MPYQYPAEFRQRVLVLHRQLAHLAFRLRQLAILLAAKRCTSTIWRDTSSIGSPPTAASPHRSSCSQTTAAEPDDRPDPRCWIPT